MPEIIESPETINLTAAQDIVFSTNGVERARIHADGTGAGLFSGYQPASKADPIHLTQLPGGLYNTKSQNALATSQDPVTTDGGYQYAVWVNDSRNPVIGVRKLDAAGTTSFEATFDTTFDLSTISGNPLGAPTTDDLHNSYTVAVDDKGYIHVSGNHHDVPLHYVRSKNPRDITAWDTPTMIGTEEDSVTYPQFVRMPDTGELLFLYRNGVSGAGDNYLNAYNSTTKTWTRRAHIFGGSGLTPQQSAYNNHIAVSAAGVIHLFYVWRITDNVSQTHDLCHIKSTDHGATWTNMAGTPLTLPILPATSPIVVAFTDNTQAGFMINSPGAEVDSSGNPHMVSWMQGAASSLWAELHHVYWDGAAWQNTTLLQLGYYLDLTQMARPIVFCSGSRVFTIYSLEGALARRMALYCADITPGASFALPTFRIFEGDLGIYEPVYDTRAVKERNELHMIVTPISTDKVNTLPEYTSAWGGLYSVDLDDIEYMAEGWRTGKRTAGPEEFFVPASALQANFGTPTFDASTEGLPAWLLSNSATQVLSALVNIPTGWNSFNVDLWWANASNGSGNIAAQLRYAFLKAGMGVKGSIVNPGDVISTAGAQDVLVTQRLITGLRRQAGFQVNLNFRRDIGGTDTLANNAAIFGFLLTKAS